MKSSYAAALLLLVAMNLMPSTGRAQTVTDGKYWYLNYCASCHGASGKGDGSIAKVLTQKPADLTTLSSVNGGVFPAARVSEIIEGRREILAHGARDMPVWGRATRIAPVMVRARISAIVEYLATIQGK